MKVQFLGKNNKILYCDDNIIRITKQKTLFKKEEVKEKNVHDFGKVEISYGPCIKLYDHYGQLWDEVCFDKEYLDRTERVAQKLRIESRKYIESFNDEVFNKNKELIPDINKALWEEIKKETSFISEIYTLPPKVFQPFHPVTVIFKKGTPHIEHMKLLEIVEVIYDMCLNVFLESGYVLDEHEEIGIQCYTSDGEEMVTYTSLDKKIVKQMIEEGKM